MYVFDFFKRLFSRKNSVQLIIYLVVNVLLIAAGMITALMLMDSTGSFIHDASMSSGEYSNLSIGVKEILIAFALSIVAYFICLVIALSPVGEFIVRIQNGCRKIADPDKLAFIEPLFNEVYMKAKRLDPSIPDNVKLFICADESVNAFAVGRKTVCVTEGLFNESPEHIKAILGHEMGHLAHKDTDTILVITVGNLLVSFIVWMNQILIALFGRVGSFFSKFFCTMIGACLPRIVGWMFDLIGFIIGEGLKLFCRFASFVVVGLFFAGWTKLGFFIMQKASRDCEYEADKFSFDLGYGDELIEVFRTFDEGPAPEGLFAALSSSHPDTESRIERLNLLRRTVNNAPVYEEELIIPKVDTMVKAEVEASMDDIAVSKLEADKSNISYAKPMAAPKRVAFSAESVSNCICCNNILRPGAKFCNSCGTPVEYVPIVPKVCTCGKCGTKLREGAKFCFSCGEMAS